jgi:hypothetical protein
LFGFGFRLYFSGKFLSLTLRNSEICLFRFLHYDEGISAAQCQRSHQSLQQQQAAPRLAHGCCANQKDSMTFLSNYSSFLLSLQLSFSSSSFASSSTTTSSSSFSSFSSSASFPLSDICVS